MIPLEAGILDINATLVAQIVVFLVTLLVLYRVAWGPVMRALEARRARIQEGLEASERAQRELQAAQEERRAQLEAARREAQQLLEQARRSGEALREEAQRKALEEAQRLQQSARAEIERERAGVAQELRAHISDLALRAAERVLGETLDAEKHRQLIERAIDEAELRV